MDLHDEFDRHASAVSAGAGERLKGAGVRARLDSRVSRARRVENAKVGAGVFAAAGALAVGAVLAPRWWGGAVDAADGPANSPAASEAASDSPSPSETVAPSPPVSSAPVDLTGSHLLGDKIILAGTVAVWDVTGPLTCDALAASAPDDGVGVDVVGQTAPVPVFLETGRLYGWGDDVLVGGTPAPLGKVGQWDYEAVQVLASDFSAGPAELVLTGADGVHWGFTVTWEERDDLPHDAPGVFAVLTPNYDCHDGVIAEGVYAARMSFTAGDQSTQVVQLNPLVVVSGVPSLPEVDAAGR